METAKEQFEKVFSKLGFEIQKTTPHQFTAFVMGKDYGVYLQIDFMSKSFSIELVCDIFTQKIFYCQFFEDYEEIYRLISKNMILSEQILEKLDLATHT